MKKFKVIYRTGGSENFAWHETFPEFKTETEARDFAESIERMGYATIWGRVSDFRHGLPESYDAQTPILHGGGSGNG